MDNPKIFCKVCHARLEINDPGCTRPDCRIRTASEYKIDQETGLYVPIHEDRVKYRKKQEKQPEHMVLLDPLGIVDEDLIIEQWASGEREAMDQSQFVPWYDDVNLVC